MNKVSDFFSSSGNCSFKFIPTTRNHPNNTPYAKIANVVLIQKSGIFMDNTKGTKTARKICHDGNFYIIIFGYYYLLLYSFCGLIISSRKFPKNCSTAIKKLQPVVLDKLFPVVEVLIPPSLQPGPSLNSS